MADYFTNFSFMMSLPSKEAQDYALALAIEGSRINQGEEKPNEFPSSLDDVTDDWSFEVDADDSKDGWGIWLHSQFGGIEAVCAFIQVLIQRFDPDGCVTFEWSNDCSKPRVDAYGGGAAIVTAQEIKTMTTWDWLQKHMPALKGDDSNTHILLRAGHAWVAVNDWPTASETAFVCSRCHQTFIHDGMDDSTNADEIESCCQ
jgi:hypothetical protein